MNLLLVTPVLENPYISYQDLLSTLDTRDID